MLIKLPIVKNNKSYNILFQIKKENNQYILKPYMDDSIYYNVVISSKKHGIYKLPVCFPFIFQIHKFELFCDLFFILTLYEPLDNDFFKLVLDKINQQKKQYKYIKDIKKIKLPKYDIINQFDNVLHLFNFLYSKVFYTINLTFYKMKNNETDTFVNIIKSIKYNYNGTYKNIEQHLTKNKTNLLFRLFFDFNTYIELFINKIFKKYNYYRKIFEYFFGIDDNIIYINFINIKEIEPKYNKYKKELLTNSELSYEFFKEIIDKDNTFNINILVELFKQYSFPLNFSKNNLNIVFKKILYYTLKFKSNLNIVYDKFKYNKQFIFLLNMLNKKDNELNYIDYYNNFEILNLIFVYNYYNISNIISNNIINNYYDIYLYLNILYNINWDNIKHKLNQMNYLFINYNENYINSCQDEKIKKILLKPISFFKYLKHENDFIKWLFVIDFKINEIFTNQIIIKKNDYFKLGRILYLFSLIKLNDMNDINYKNAILYMAKNSYLVLHNNKINIKFKDIFKNKHINLGYIAKNITLNIDYSLTFVNNDIVVYDNLENKMEKYLLKYQKYREKYEYIKGLKLLKN